jgi:hypothetical protein
MHDLLIYRDADVARIFSIAQERALGAKMLDPRRSKLIHVLGCHSGLNESGDIVQHCARHRARWSHRFQVPLTL